MMILVYHVCRGLSSLTTVSWSLLLTSTAIQARICQQTGASTSSTKQVAGFMMSWWRGFGTSPSKTSPQGTQQKFIIVTNCGYFMQTNNKPWTGYVLNLTKKSITMLRWRENNDPETRACPTHCLLATWRDWITPHVKKIWQYPSGG